MTQIVSCNILYQISCVRKCREVSHILIIREVEYAVSIIEALHHNGSMKAQEISRMKNLPGPFIYRILKRLEAGGIISIKRGPQGGYTLEKDCSQLTLCDIIDVFDNTFLVIECMKEEYQCGRNHKGDCCMHGEFGRIQNVLREEFKRKSLASLFD